MQPTSHSTLGKKCSLETSLVVQWLGLDLPMQGIGGSVPGQGVKIPPASWPKKKKKEKNQDTKQKQYWNKFNNNFKSGPDSTKI